MKAIFTEKGHGRVTIWVIGVCRLGPEMRAHLEALGRSSGYRVEQQEIVPGERRQGTRFGLAGAPWDLWVRLGPPWDAEGTRFGWPVLRGHGSIENRSFYVLDVTWCEEAQWGRWMAKGLHRLRSWAVTLLRGWGFRWMPMGQRTCDAAADALMAWLVQGKLPGPCVNS